MESIKVAYDNGEEEELYVLEQTQVAGNTYLLATSAVDEETEELEEAEAWIFKQVSISEDDVYYEVIEDDTELEAVAKVFEAMLEDCNIEL
ncbi:MAG: DUF1292 domain-containing protein [Lachnospiraceae bacterium]|nr:DUF1292 domain-containing protein [Lachnospiraceae bacterium]